MPLSTTEFATAMKEYYLGPLNDQIYRSTVMLDRLTKNSEDVEGRYAYVPLISGRNVAVGSRVDGNQGAAGAAATAPKIPEAGRQSYAAATFIMAYHYGRGSVSGPVMRASKTNSGAFAKAMDREMRGLMESLPEDLNRQLWSYGHGRGASLGAAIASGGGTTMTCRNDSIFSLKVGDRVHISPITAGAAWYPAVGTTVSSITRDVNATQHQVVLAATTGNTATAATDAVYFGANSSNIAAGDSSRAQEMYGIPAAVDDGNIGADEGVTAVGAEFAEGNLNYGQIARTNTFWRAQVLQNSTQGTNRPLTVSLMEQAWLTVITVGGADAKAIDMYTNPSLWATFGLLHIGDRRYNDYKDTLKGGWEALMFNGQPLLYDRDAPRDIIWFLDMKTMMLLTSSGYQMMDEDGSVLHRVSNRDEYEFTLFRDCQLGCRNASKNLKLDDLTAAVTVEG
jgi:hypothetical protein